MSDDTRRRLIDAAAEVFAEQGYDGAGVAEVARRAGLTTGAIYSRFRGKADLLIEAIDDRMGEEIQRLFAYDPETPVPDVIAAMGADVGARSFTSGQALVLEAVVASRREPELGERLARRLEDDRARFAKLVDDAKGAGTLDPDLDTEAVVMFCQSVGLGFLLFRALGTPSPDPDTWDALIARLVAACARPEQEPA